jgi:hypothetical protein
LLCSMCHVTKERKHHDRVPIAPSLASWLAATRRNLLSQNYVPA